MRGIAVALLAPFLIAAGSLQAEKAAPENVDVFVECDAINAPLLVDAKKPAYPTAVGMLETCLEQAYPRDKRGDKYPIFSFAVQKAMLPLPDDPTRKEVGLTIYISTKKPEDSKVKTAFNELRQTIRRREGRVLGWLMGVEINDESL